MPPKLTIRRAEPADLPALDALREETVAWLASKGLSQWQPGEPGKASPGGLAALIDTGTLWVAYDGDQLAATVTIDDNADPEFWAEEERAEPARYVHRMMVARRYAGQDLGAVLLDLAEDIAREAGAGYLRLDSWKDNEGLHDYYRSQGFEQVRSVDLEHRGSGALFERRLGTTRRDPGPRA